MNNYNENELNYLVFILGYDLLQEYLSNVGNNVYECDNAYDVCHHIAHEFLKSGELEKNVRYSTYDVLRYWVRDTLTTNKKCPKCGGKLLKSFTEGYDYQCYGCDEDFYKCEVEGE